MRPASQKTKTFYFQSDAHSLGGFIKQPSHKIVPSQAHSSLPGVGGHVEASTDAFNHDSIVSCKKAYTRVSGREHVEGGPWSMVVTSVIEGLNILEVLTADRIVGQIAVEYDNAGTFPRVSFAGSHFEGLKLAHHDLTPILNPTLMNLPGGTPGPLTEAQFQTTSTTQAGNLTKAGNPAWVSNRFGWMGTPPKAGVGQCVLCSLVEGVSSAIPGKSFGHVIEIPEFGRVFLGEVFACHSSFRLSMVRAELGCTVEGQLDVAMGTIGGRTVPP
ncbi:hypothetical protein [Granulicella sp. S190]|uniref:hypothetical protein n=1 Tax=Granulicella sp. S190 TaxID=1747226 RepID=UPI00131A7502|nr:hypothetical protein [Granulicella sp. S190]